MSKAAKAETEEKTPPTNVSGQKLAAFMDRIRRLEEEKKAAADDIKDVYSEAKSLGFEPSIIREILRLEKIDMQKAREKLELLELYASSAGINLPLFSSAFK